MQSIFYKLPLPRFTYTCPSINKKAHFYNIVLEQPENITTHCQSSNVRFMRSLKDKDSTRFALSGKLSDVCAALDLIAKNEARINSYHAAH